MDSKAMNRLTYGLFVLTVREGEKDNGCIVNTVGQVTSSPNRISVTVNKANATHDMLVRTGECNISVLAEDAPFALFRRFGFASGRNEDKFEGYRHAFRVENGIYYIAEGTNAYLCAKVVQRIDLGTHTMFLADVTDGEVLSDVPAATYAYYHAHIKPKPAQKPPERTVWRCKVCGYEYEGETLPDGFVCPICKHGAEDFERVGGEGSRAR